MGVGSKSLEFRGDHLKIFFFFKTSFFCRFCGSWVLSWLGRERVKENTYTGIYTERKRSFSHKSK